MLLIAVLFAHDVFSQAPTSTSFSPTSAPTGTQVTITGTNFTGSASVNFGGTPAASFNIVSSTQITAIVAGGASGSVNVTKNVQAGTRSGFTFLSPVTRIITDFAGYWSSTLANNNPEWPGDSHNLLAFTYNGVTYPRGLTIAYLPGRESIILLVILNPCRWPIS